MISHEDLITRYLVAHADVLRAGYGHEIQWAETVNFDNVDERTFLMEHAHVVVNSGFRAAVAAKLWPGLRAVFGDWNDTGWIVENQDAIRTKALAILNYPAKINAILQAARMMHKCGWKFLYWQIVSDPLNYLRSFGFIGPITRHHLARNLGFDTVKPDVHLVRLAEQADRESPLAMCKEIAEETGDRLGVIDVVLWRMCSTVAPGVPMESWGG